MDIVVVADDDAAMREMVAYMVQQHFGARVIEAEDGEKALAVLRSARPDVLIPDMQMPVLNGSATLRAIRADSELCALPVVAMSAAAHEGEARAEGCTAFLRKPLTMSALVTTVEPHVRVRASGG